MLQAFLRNMNLQQVKKTKGFNPRNIIHYDILLNKEIHKKVNSESNHFHRLFNVIAPDAQVE